MGRRTRDLRLGDLGLEAMELEDVELEEVGLEEVELEELGLEEVELGDLGLGVSRTRGRAGTRGRDKQTTPDICAEFVERNFR